MSGDLTGCGKHAGRCGPGGVEIPAVTVGVEGDVVADGGVRGDAIQPLLASVVEPHRALEPVPASWRVRPVPQRFREHDGHRTGVRVDGDRVVPERGTGLAVSGEKPSGRVPLRAPLIETEADVGEMVTSVGQSPPTGDDRRPAFADALLDAGKPSPEDLNATLLADTLVAIRIAANTPLPFPARYGQTLFDSADRPGETGFLSAQAPKGQPVLVLGCPVIAPAHRDDDPAVRFLLRRARCVCFNATSPIRTRSARSDRAGEPRCPPARVSTFSSAADTRRRSRIRAPDGAATVNGAAISRSFLVPPPRLSPRVRQLYRLFHAVDHSALLR